MKSAEWLTLLLVFSMLSAAPALADSKSSMRGWLEGAETGFVPGPAIPDGRCPAEAQWILEAGGTARIRELGAFAWESAHCSWPVELLDHGAEGRLGGGEMTLTHDQTGDQLWLRYEGRWVFIGDLTTGNGDATIRQTYEVAGGTGQFEGATGEGSMKGSDRFHIVAFRMHGELEH